MFEKMRPQIPAGEPLPVLLPPEKLAQQGLKEALLQRAARPSSFVRYAAHRAAFAAPLGIAYGLTRGGDAMEMVIGTGLAFGAILGGSAAYRTALKLGGAHAISKVYANAGQRAAARSMIDLFAAIGTRAGQEGTNDLMGESSETTEKARAVR